VAIATPAARRKEEILSASNGERNKGEVSKRNRYVMLTTVPNETVRPFHHRMPLIVRRGKFLARRIYCATLRICSAFRSS
jgi:hypothetical protein